MITWQNVSDIAPELATVATGTQAALLSIVQRWVSDDAWGDFADDGRAYLAAHLASIKGNRGLVTSETLGPMSRAYAMPPGVMGSLAMSVYGAEYERMLRAAIGIAAFVP